MKRSGHGIVSMATPWVTPHDPFQAEPPSLDGTMFPYCLDAVIGTGWSKPAGSRE